MYAGAYANRAGTYSDKGQIDLAAKDYDEAIRLAPTVEAIWNGRCWCRAIIGELDAALADCNEALRLRPDDPAALDSRGLAYLKKGQLDLAIEDYNSALQLDSKLAGALYGRGLAKLNKGDVSGANADMAAAKEIAANIVADFARLACPESGCLYGVYPVARLATSTPQTRRALRRLTFSFEGIVRASG